MKRALFGLLIVGLLATSVASLGQGEKTKVRTDCPQGECCLWRLGLTTKGRMIFKLGKPYKCPKGMTARGSGSLELKPLKSTGLPCDEQPKLIPDGSRLNAAIHPIRREDDLTHICGTFTIYYQKKALFEGDLELFHRVNTHHKPFGPDPCNQENHLQGWLKGKGTDNSRAKGFLLRALLVARTEPSQGGTAGYAIGTAYIDGVVIKCKQ